MKDFVRVVFKGVCMSSDSNYGGRGWAASDHPVDGLLGPDVIPAHLGNRVICLDGRPLPGESSLQRMLEGRIQHLHPFTQLRIAFAILQDRERAVRALQNYGADDDADAAMFKGVVELEAKNAEFVQQDDGSSPLQSPFTSAVVCEESFALQVLGWWASKMALSNQNGSNFKSPVAAYVHTMQYLVDDVQLELRVYHIGTLHHIAMIKCSGELPAQLRDELQGCLIALNGGDGYDIVATEYQVLLNNCVSVTSDIKRLLEAHSGQEQGPKVHLPHEMQAQLDELVESDGASKRLVTMVIQHQAGADSIVCNPFGKPRFRVCENNVAGLQACFRAFIVKRGGEEQSASGDIKLSAAQKVLNSFSNIPVERLTEDEITALGNSRLGMIVSHFAQCGESKIQAELGVLLEGGLPVRRSKVGFLMDSRRMDDEAAALAQLFS
jgi:hypothetical protein